MSTLDAKALAREVASPLFWRRQTAQRLLVERGDHRANPDLRHHLTVQKSDPATIFTTLRTLEGLGALSADDLRPLLSHRSEAVRLHALQLADRWFSREDGGPVLEAVLAAAKSEKSPRVLLQFALSLGESKDPRAFAMLVRFAREPLAVRWMNTALLSSLRGRAGEMLAELLSNPSGDPKNFLSQLAQTIAARRDEPELPRALSLIASAKPETQASILGGLAKGRMNAPRQPLRDDSARLALARLAASPHAEVRTNTHALEMTFLATAADDESLFPGGQLPSLEPLSEDSFRKFVGALSGPRDLKRGRELFVQACATCHRVGQEGYHVGPDLMGQLGLAEEALLKDILLPNERIRPGYETTLVRMADNSTLTGILKDDGATSLTLATPNRAEQVVLRKDVRGVRRLATSLMPAYAETLSPADLAHMLGWLRSQLGTSAPKFAPPQTPK